MESLIPSAAKDDRGDAPATLHRSHVARLVVNAATLESVVEAQAALREAGWSYELVQLAVSRGREVGGRTRLEPLGPVFILSAWPGDGGGGV